MSANLSTDLIHEFPPEIVEACKKLTLYMETFGHNYWCIAGVCDRRWAYLNEEKRGEFNAIPMFEDKQVEILKEEK